MLRDGTYVEGTQSISNNGEYLFFIPDYMPALDLYTFRVMDSEENEMQSSSSSFRILPNIEGRWSFSNLSSMQTGTQMDVVLNYISNQITGSGYFYFKYNYGGSPRGFESGVSVSGNYVYPLVSLSLSGSEGKVFNFFGEFTSYDIISGHVSGYIDDTWESLDEQVVLEKD